MTPTIALFYALTVAWLPTDNTFVNDLKVKNNNVFEAKLDAELVIAEYFYVGGNIETKTLNRNGLSFSPYFDTYQARVGVKIPVDGIYFDLQYLHECRHPVMMGTIGGGSVNVGGLGGFFGGYDKISLTVSNRK